MIEKHCVSFDLAKQLKESGWDKETKFWWVEHKDIATPTKWRFLGR